MKTNAPAQLVGKTFRWHNFPATVLVSGTRTQFSVPVPMGFCSAIIHAKGIFNHNQESRIRLRTYQISGRDLGYGTPLTEDSIIYPGAPLSADDEVCTLVRRMNLATSQLMLEFVPLSGTTNESVQLSVLLLVYPVYDGVTFLETSQQILYDCAIHGPVIPPLNTSSHWSPECTVQNVGFLEALQVRVHFVIRDSLNVLVFDAYSGYVNLAVQETKTFTTASTWTPTVAGNYFLTSTLDWAADQNVVNNEDVSPFTVDPAP